MRLSAIFLRFAALSAGAVLSAFAAQTVVTELEVRSVEAVDRTLLVEGYEWASVLGDGLQIVLEGEAPTEAARFGAMSAAGTVVDPSRVIDSLNVAKSQVLTAPDFAVEILRNDAGVSLIGLIPADTNRNRLTRSIGDIADGLPVTDLLDTANFPAPDSWDDAMDYALRALDMLTKSKISVSADRVVVEAIADSPDEKRRLEIALARNAPGDVRLAVDISAPRPVISPFTTRFSLGEDGARFDACTADSAAAVDIIVQAASAAGKQDRTTCVIALGAPSREWGTAVALSIRAIGDLGGGTVTVSDTDITLTAAQGTDAELFERTIGQLENALPDAFVLAAALPQAPVEDADELAQFTATLSPEGAVQLRGRLPDEMTTQIVENFAKARFVRTPITMGTLLADGLPQGWSLRVLAAVDALSNLSNGAVEVTADVFSVRGNTGNQDASADIARLLIDKLGQTADFDIDVRYVETLDPIASLPTPQECIDRIIATTEGQKITFDPGSADLTAATQPIVDEIADILKECGDLPIRVAGFTDSQGRETMNQQLSQRRAEAVLTALRARRVPVSTFEAIGFGEADPIADNDTEEGREANRRIEFSLIVPERPSEGPEAPEEAAEQGTEQAFADETADETPEIATDPDTDNEDITEDTE